MRPETLVVHATRTAPGEGLVTPIYQAAPFRLADTDQAAEVGVANAPSRYYTRWGNPTVRALEDTVAALEGGDRAIATSSGMGAIGTVLLHHARSGKAIVSQEELYAGTAEYLRALLPDLGTTTSFVPGLDEEGWKEAITQDVGLVYLETPSNPAMAIADIRLVSDLAADVGAAVAVDNTFATPINQRPIEQGATYVAHSATKYLAGHSDATGGVIVGPDEDIGRMWRTYKITGPSPAPIESFLVLRGIKTLGLRMQRHNANAAALADWLAQHPAVEHVAYPGLPDFPGHDVAKRQMSGYGGMVSFEVRGGLEAARTMVGSTNICALAVSLGGVESMVQHPATMTHAPLPKEAREAVGVTDGQVRLSVGIEDLEDLKEDLDGALRKATGT